MFRFNGRKIVSIAIDSETDEPSDVMSRFGDSDIQFIVMPNHVLGETIPFVEHLLPQVRHEPGVTFYAHAKGSSHGTTDLPFITAWTRQMVKYNLTPDALDLLNAYEAAGIYRRKMDWFGSAWHYSGTFFWFRNEAIFGRHDRNWRSIVYNRYGVESYLGRLIPYEAAACIYGEDAPNLYCTIV